MKPVTILKKARKLLSNPKRWTKGELARDRAGDATLPASTKAVCFCAEGVLRKYCGLGTCESSPVFDSAFAILHSAAPNNTNPIVYNDGRLSHANLLKWFDRAIARAEKLEVAK